MRHMRRACPTAHPSPIVHPPLAGPDRAGRPTRGHALPSQLTNSDTRSRARHAKRLTRALTGSAARAIALIAALCALLFAPSALASPARTTTAAAPNATGPPPHRPRNGHACWATQLRSRDPTRLVHRQREIFDANALTAAPRSASARNCRSARW